MIKNPEKLRQFENELIRKEKLNVLKNFRIVDAMYKEALALGVFPMKDALSDIEVDIKIARVVNSVSDSP